MGRWAQARKRGHGGDGSGFPFLAPVYNTDWTYQLLDGGETIEVSMPDEPLPDPKWGLRVERSDNGGAWYSPADVSPGNSYTASGLLGQTTLQLRTTWVDIEGAALSVVGPVVDVPLGEE